jgi:hypothetical protein
MFLPLSSFSSFYSTLTSENFFSFLEMVIKSVGFSPSLFSLYYLHFTFRINNFSIYFFIVHFDAVLTSLFFLSSIFIFPFFQIFCVRRLLIFNNLHLRFPPCSCFLIVFLVYLSFSLLPSIFSFTVSLLLLFIYYFTHTSHSLPLFNIPYLIFTLTV